MRERLEHLLQPLPLLFHLLLMHSIGAKVVRIGVVATDGANSYCVVIGLRKKIER